jgi:hypothetical protein
MADVKAIRDALKTRLDAVAGLRTFDTLPDSFTPPAAIVMPASDTFITDATFDGGEDLQFVVLVLVQKVSDRGSQDALDTYLSSGSADIRAAIDSATATPYWHFAQTSQVRNYGLIEWGTGEAAQRYLGFEVPVTVAAP